MGELQGTVAGRFQIDKLAGSGGMGAVYRAWDSHSGSIVALKVLHAQNTAATERFGREAMLLDQLGHPNIVRCVAHGHTEQNEPYLAMEWLDGEDLGELLGRRVLTVDEAMRLGVLVADALGAAHGLGVVHRDLKPPNIFLVDGQIDRIKLVDFGIARDTSEHNDRLTRTGILLGTPAYMAPEQVRAAKAVGPQADVWALGAVLFQCLTGRYLFMATTPMAMAVSALTDEPPALSSVLPSVPPELDAVVANFLAREAEYRARDGAAAAELLRGIGAGLAPPPRPAQAMPAGGGARCLVLVRPPESEDPSAPMLAEVRSLVERQQAELLVLADGTAAVVVARTESLDQQLAAAAQCALALRALAPTAAIAVVAEQAGAGKTQVAARSGVELLDDATPPQISVGELAARHMPQPYDIKWAGDRATLASPGAAPAMPAAVAGRDAFVQGVVGGPTQAAPIGASTPGTQPEPGPAAAQSGTAPMGIQPMAEPAIRAERRTNPALYIALGAMGAFLLAIALAAGGWFYVSSGHGDSEGVSFDDDDESEESDQPAPCPARECVRLRVPSPKRFDPTDAASAVIGAVHGPYRGAKLTMINASGLRAGTVDLTSDDQDVFYAFQRVKGAKTPSVYVHVERDRLRLTPTDITSPFAQRGVPAPKCKLQRAWRVASQNGLDKGTSFSAMYMRSNHPMTGKNLGAVWQLVAEESSEMWYLDGDSCALVADFDPTELIRKAPTY